MGSDEEGFDVLEDDSMGENGARLSVSAPRETRLT